MKVKNAWLCQIENRSVKPIFCDFTIEEGKNKNIFERNFNEFTELEYDIIDSDCYDVQGAVITVPNVNFHDHIYSRLAKGLPLNGPMDNFQNILKNLWWKLDLALDKDMIVASAHMAAYESILNGVQYIFDHHASPGVTEGSLECIKSVLREYGLKGVLAFETSDRNGDKLKQDALLENNSFLVDYCDDDFKGMYGLHASFTLNNDTLRHVEKYIKGSEIGIHIHLSEDESDNIISKDKYGARPLERLINYNLVNDRSILSHAVYLNKDDYELLDNYKCAIVFNPDSNMNNSVGFPCISEFSENQMFLLGTDGMHANVAKSMKQLFLMLRCNGKSFEESFRLINRVYFDQIEFIKKYYPHYSNLKENDSADFIVWDYVPPTPLTEDNFMGHYLYGIIERSVKSSISGGEFLMNNFRTKVPDMELFSKQIYKAGNSLYEILKSNQALL
ncbi:MAG: amidohydrolase family protein [Melioribacteraceae bacterium]|nr:amidohydrolase family protein [Melioribacteraceae bacterium]